MPDVVANGLGAGGVGADVVALHHIVVRVGDQDAVGVDRNEVAGPGRGAADRVAIREAELDAVARVDNGLGAGVVGADVVAQHQVACRAAPEDREAVTDVARKEIARRQRRPDHVAGYVVDHHTAAGVAQASGTYVIDANDATVDHVITLRIQVNPIATESHDFQPLDRAAARGDRQPIDAESSKDPHRFQSAGSPYNPAGRYRRWSRSW